MFTSTITDPNGRQWRVSLQFIPTRQGIGLRERFIGRHTKKQKKPGKVSWLDFVGVPDSIDDIRIIMAFIVVALVFTFVGWPLLLMLADLIWLVLVILGAILSFIVLKRPITISAKSQDEYYAWKIVGLAQALKFKQNLADSLSRGVIQKTS